MTIGHFFLLCIPVARMVGVEVSTTVPLWIDVCGKLAPIASVLVCAAPLPTILQIARDRTVASLPLLPYSSLIVSCVLWTTYGLLIGEIKLYLSNIIGLILALFYFVTFTRHAPNQSPTLPGSVQQHLRIVSSIALGTTLLGLSNLRSKVYLVGKIAMIFSIALFASPLASIQTVLATKSARSLPLPFSLASLISCFVWSVVGVLEMKNFDVSLPSLLGFTSSLLQVVLKMVYGNAKPVDLAL